MKKIFILLTILLIYFVFGQVGINTTTPRGALEISSPHQNQGMVLPSVTKIEDVINPQTNNANVPSGTIVFDISRNAICIRYGNQWQCTDINGKISIVNPTSSFLPNYTYIKASNTRVKASFGCSVSLSSDGSTLAVGSYGEKSNATGINGNQTNTSMLNAGAVYVFTHRGKDWVQEAYIKASNTRENAQFGWSVSLSLDGSTLAVGSYKESSNAIGINGGQIDASMSQAGAVYVFKRTTEGWIQETYVKASNTRTNAYFGCSVSLSSDGSTMIVGSWGESSNATGVNGNQADASMPYAGAVYVFKRTGDSWAQEAYIKPSNTKKETYFGRSLALSSDNSTLVVGGYLESSNAIGINGDQTDTSMGQAGAVYVFKRIGASWVQEAYIKASNTRPNALFGYSVSLSSDGSIIAVGSVQDTSNSKGINGDQVDASMSGAGAVYIFKRTGTSWTQEAYIKASNTRVGAYFGWCVSLSSDGSTLAVGSMGESSNATGINGDQGDASMNQPGAIYVFKRTRKSWTQEAYVKASNTRGGARFGGAVTLSSDSSTMAVGSTGEYSNATGINGDQANTSMLNAGAVYVLQNY